MTTTSPNIDARAFRHALGQFATGVTVITTFDVDDAPVGMTVNSFNSVSLDPPLVLWSLSRDALSFDAFMSAESFAVHVLGADQESLSNRFASKGEDKFAGLVLKEGQIHAPLLEECSARFQCVTRHRYEGGDHVILIGEVIAFERFDRAPLVFHSGRYADARPRENVARDFPLLDLQEDAASSGRLPAEREQAQRLFTHLLSRGGQELGLADLAPEEITQLRTLLSRILTITESLDHPE